MAHAAVLYRPSLGNKNKRCTSCEAWKPRDEFYKQPGALDGRQNQCKECAKERVKANYRKNIEYYQEYDRQRAMLPHRVEAREQYRRTPDGKKAVARAHKSYHARCPEKRRATIIVGNAVRDGRLTKPNHCGRCRVECSTKRSLHAHHADYSKPLEVEWLCGTCHRLEHRPLREPAKKVA